MIREVQILSRDFELVEIIPIRFLRPPNVLSMINNFMALDQKWICIQSFYMHKRHEIEHH